MIVLSIKEKINQGAIGIQAQVLANYTDSLLIHVKKFNDVFAFKSKWDLFIKDFESTYQIVFKFEEFLSVAVFFESTNYYCGLKFADYAKLPTQGPRTNDQSYMLKTKKEILKHSSN